MLQQYISTGYYVNDCANGLQVPITGIYVYTGFLDQCESDGKAYYLAQNLANQLRAANPCLSDSTTTTTTTTSTTTLPPDSPLSGSGISFNWINDFNGENGEYYDIVAWGNTQGYLSGNKYDTNQYFSQISANDVGGYGVVLAVIKGSGLVTGFGSNVYNQLDIPNNLTGVIQVSVGYDHVLILKNNGTVSGWGRDNFGALNINSSLPYVQKCCAGIGGSIFLLNSGIITGTNTIGGGYTISYPNVSGFINVEHYSNHVLCLTSGGLLTGFGINNFGETDTKDLNGVYKMCAGISTSMSVFNDGDVTGYGTNQALYNTPVMNHSGVDIQLRGHIGTILKKDQDIEQWVDPWSGEVNNIIKPSYLQNNIVAISQGTNFTTAIFKRANNCTINPQVLTGYDFLWKVVSSDFDNIHSGDLYAPSGQVIQSCDCYSFFLPLITGSNQTHTELGVTNCTPYAGTRSVDFISIKPYQILNINYTKTGYAPKTGYAGTGITTGDYWNPFLHTDITNKSLYYENGSLSPVSGGYVSLGTGSGISWSHSDNMYATFISGISGSFNIRFDHFALGEYIPLLYGHGPNSGQNTYFHTYLNGVSIGKSGTTTGVDFNSTTFIEGTQYVKGIANGNRMIIQNTGDYYLISITGFINGIQFIKIS